MAQSPEIEAGILRSRRRRRREYGSCGRIWTEPFSLEAVTGSGDLGGGLLAAAVCHQYAGKVAFLDCLAEPAGEALGVLGITQKIFLTC